MRNVAMIFSLLLCLFALLEITLADKIIFSTINKTVEVKPMHRPLTKKEIKNLEPKIDGIPKGRKKPHPMTGQVNRKRPTIIGGHPAPINRFPWMCNIVLDAAVFCGGSVISPTFVLTAGHCVFEFRLFVLFMGSTNSIDPVDSVTFVSLTSFLHPQYVDITFENDIGLIRLPHAIDNRYITAGTIVPIRLPSRTQASKSFEGRLATVSGWGLTDEDGGISVVLNFVSVPIISNEKCALTLGEILISSMMCTWLQDDVKGPCSGDSGGALQITECDNIHTQIGIVSFGSPESCSVYPEVYTRVSSFLAWISGITGLAIRP